MKTWLEPSPVSLPNNFQEAIGGHPLVAESLLRRGIHDVTQAQAFLNPAHYQPTSADALPDMDKAVERLQKAIRQKEQILVWGDFDVDGQTSTALLVSALRDLGAKINYHVPNRFTEGHGIHLPTLKTYLDGGIDLLLTCDTGITAHGSIDYAQKRNMDVIITDHHTLSDSLPNAHAIINPMRLAEGHPLRELPGVGTAYKLIEALYGNQSTEHLLDLVAMGIVADVMVQVDDTRYLLQRGLDVLRNNPRAGLSAMMERAGIDANYLTEMDIGFSLAPRLNAIGRLADANAAVELLTTTDAELIAEHVTVLEGLNQKRRFLTQQVYQAAQQQIADDDSLLKYAALIIAGENWHTGVVGIVASRLAEDYKRPVIVLSEQDGKLSGSARSVSGANIIQAIRTQSDLLDGFGGHNMAAGLRMNADNLFVFRRGLSQTIREMLGHADIEPHLEINAYLNFDEIDLNFAEDISRLAPFGNGNPPLTLATKNVRVKSRRNLGRRGDHLELRLVDEQENEQRLISWFANADTIPQGRFDIAYTVRTNMFNGKHEALVEWMDVRAQPDSSIEVQQQTYDIIDHRQHSNPLEQVQKVIQQYPDALICAEGDKRIDAVNHYHLEACETLIIWTVPASLAIWQTILNITNPQRLILFGEYPRFDNTKSFLTYILGMGRYAMNKRDGIVSLEDMTTATAHNSGTIRAAIQWVNANTKMSFKLFSEDTYRVTEDIEAIILSPPPQTVTRLDMLLKETQSYRLFWLKSETIKKWGQSR